MEGGDRNDKPLDGGTAGVHPTKARSRLPWSLWGVQGPPDTLNLDSWPLEL